MREALTACERVNVVAHNDAMPSYAPLRPAQAKLRFTTPFFGGRSNRSNASTCASARGQRSAANPKLLLQRVALVARHVAVVLWETQVRLRRKDIEAVVQSLEADVRRRQAPQPLPARLLCVKSSRASAVGTLQAVFCASHCHNTCSTIGQIA
jgi:hypothetical protein